MGVGMSAPMVAARWVRWDRRSPGRFCGLIGTHLYDHQAVYRTIAEHVESRRLVAYIFATGAPLWGLTDAMLVTGSTPTSSRTGSSPASSLGSTTPDSPRERREEAATAAVTHAMELQTRLLNQISEQQVCLAKRLAEESLQR